MKRIFKSIGWIALIILLGAQFFQIDRTNPEHNPASDFLATLNPPAEVTETFKNACYDCHSHLTRYPWYTYIQPVGAWVKGHIREGRESLNFSIWQNYQEEDKPLILKEIAKEISRRSMPLRSYTYAHKSAKLSDSQIDAMISWIRSQGVSPNGSNPVNEGKG
jgi:hypothetical protein